MVPASDSILPPGPNGNLALQPGPSKPGLSNNPASLGRSHHRDMHHHRLFRPKCISRTIAAALDGLSGSVWLSSFSERRAMISFSASRIVASISAGHLRLSDLSSCSAIALARCSVSCPSPSFRVSNARPRIAPRAAACEVHPLGQLQGSTYRHRSRRGTIAVRRNAPSPTKNATRTVSQVAKFK